MAIIRDDVGHSSHFAAHQISLIAPITKRAKDAPRQLSLGIELAGKLLTRHGSESARNCGVTLMRAAQILSEAHRPWSQKYESDATLFVCYDAVTPLRERFCQNAFARRGDGSRSGTCHLGVQLGGSARPLHCPTPGQPRSRATGRRQLYGCTGAAAFLPFLPHCGLRTALCHAQRTLC